MSLQPLKAKGWAGHLNSDLKHVQSCNKKETAYLLAGLAAAACRNILTNLFDKVWHKDKIWPDELAELALFTYRQK